MIPNRALTKNFSLHELLQSQEAVRSGFTEQFSPPPAVVANLEALCIHILQPLREAVQVPVVVNSGYRCERVNRGIGGSAKSQHLTGHAADIQSFTYGNEALFKKIIDMGLPFDQLINEFGYAWVHVSYDPKRNRRQVLEAYKDSRFGVRYRLTL